MYQLYLGISQTRSGSVAWTSGSQTPVFSWPFPAVTAALSPQIACNK